MRYYHARVFGAVGVGKGVHGDDDAVMVGVQLMLMGRQSSGVSVDACRRSGLLDVLGGFFLGWQSCRFLVVIFLGDRCTIEGFPVRIFWGFARLSRIQYL